ncbi:MAG: carbohydrate ABC transporter permease [Oscillospiraceae bacterium]|nr:carbohydrate ABC transporter permease [Oscillospiraceae bacterium]
MKTKKKGEFAKLPTGDKTLLIIGYVILGLFIAAIVLPIIYIILASFIDPITLQNKGLTFDFSKWTTTAYERVLGNKQIWVGFKNALIYSVLFTIISVVVTLLAAYPMSRTDFKGRGFFNTIFVITMFFGGGLIPTYLLISNLHMLDTIWAILIPGAFSVWNMIIARTYYLGIPKDLQEAAEIDGASEMVYFFKILLPVCTPIIATISMWQFVGMWNSYFDAMIYLNDASKQPLQLVLRAILIQSQPEAGMVSDMQSTAERAQLAELLKYATIIISSLPLMIMYPFFQKYFDNGIMAGAVKG